MCSFPFHSSSPPRMPTHMASPYHLNNLWRCVRLREDKCFSLLGTIVTRFKAPLESMEFNLQESNLRSKLLICSSKMREMLVQRAILSVWKSHSHAHLWLFSLLTNRAMCKITNHYWNRLLLFDNIKAQSLTGYTELDVHDSLDWSSSVFTSSFKEPVPGKKRLLYKEIYIYHITIGIFNLLRNKIPCISADKQCSVTSILIERKYNRLIVTCLALTNSLCLAFPCLWRKLHIVYSVTEEFGGYSYLKLWENSFPRELHINPSKKKITNFLQY